MDIAHKVDLWQAINAYTESCGGDTSGRTISEARMTAVAAVSSVVATNDDARRSAIAELDRVRHHLEWIGQQFCDRTKDADVRVCPGSGDCLTEWCLSCYAWVVLRGDRCDECGQAPDGCYCAEDAETKEAG